MSGRSNRRSDVLEEKSHPLLIGPDVIRHLLPVGHPMIMVDRITQYGSQALTAERFVSANEPAFVGHFPDLSVWPGILTIEGLRQCCALLEVLRRLDDADLLDGLRELQMRNTLKPRIDDAAAERVLDALEGVRKSQPLPLVLRVKLLAPVFAGCVIAYRVRQPAPDARSWSVHAEVNGQSVARGEIEWHPTDG